MNKIRLGIAGTGSIVRRTMTDMQNCEHIEVTALASRDLGRAEAAARKYGIPQYYGSYEELAESDCVDLVYIAVPNHRHKELSCLMMNRGKHVICEKPLAMNAAEAREMVQCARRNNVFFMEAMWTRFMPAIIKLRKLIWDGEIGHINHIYGCFSYACDYEHVERLNSRAMGGGALKDVGVYPLMLITLLLGCRPMRVEGMSTFAKSGVDVRTSVTMKYTNGATAQFMCGIDTDSRSELMIYGNEGTIEVPQFWHAEGFNIVKKDGSRAEYSFRHETEGHHYEFDHAAICIAEGLIESPVVTHEESIEVCRLCDIIMADGPIEC